jgi:plasmid stabilization system protein ParE
MVRKVVWTPEPRADLRAIKSYIAGTSPGNAQTVVRAIASAAEQIATFPYAHRVIPELQDSDRRETFVHRWRIMFRVFLDRIRIVGVIHGARLLSNISARSFEEGPQPEYVAS